jgi:4-hydroxybenzoate polyprenyltransferase
VREIVKDVEDEAGDQATGARTLAIVMGARNAQKVAALLTVLLIIATIIPQQMGLYSTRYLFLVCAGVNFPLLIIAITLWFGCSPAGIKRVERLLKLLMAIGMLTLYLG